MGLYRNRSKGRKILQNDRPSRKEDRNGGPGRCSRRERETGQGREGSSADDVERLTCLRRRSLSSVSGRLTKLRPERQRLLGSLETLSGAPRPLPWQRHSAPPCPRGGVGSAPWPGGGTGSVFTVFRGFSLGRRHLAIAL